MAEWDPSPARPALGQDVGATWKPRGSSDQLRAQLYILVEQRIQLQQQEASRTS